jgi:hypothetical protein
MPQTLSNREHQIPVDRNLPMHHQALPIMEYPRNSNLPFDHQQPDSQTQNSAIHNQVQQNDNYFMKIPNATQNSHQLYQGGTIPNQAGYYPLMTFPIQSIPIQPVPIIGNNHLNQGPLPAFQKQSLPQHSNDMEQIQKQLQDLQKTVQQQNKMIRTLTLKKNPPKKTQ